MIWVDTLSRKTYRSLRSSILVLLHFGCIDSSLYLTTMLPKSYLWIETAILNAVKDLIRQKILLYAQNDIVWYGAEWK